ncbi:MAG TPA: TonB-dependent receptor [Kofleriaceae bacterium]|nr:TonB-dependent receptor [Kofleriaceae bacterium]
MSLARWASLAAALIATGGVAQGEELPYVVAGLVTDARTGLPVAGAMIVTGDDVILGDDAGRFAVAGSARFVVVQAPGYSERTLALTGDRIAALEVVLDPKEIADEVIELVSEAPDLGDAPSHGLDADELRSMPGAMGDALRAVQALPEVARVPFSLGGLAVRGMSPRDTDAYLDGVPIPQAFHAGGVAAVIPSATIAGLELVPGAVDVRYGGMLGGVVLLHSRAPRADRVRLRAEVSPLDVQVGGEGPFADGAVAIGVRRAHLDEVVAPFLSDDTLVPTYWDAQVQWRRAIGRGELSMMLILADSALVIEEGTLGTQSVRVASRYTHAAGPWTTSVLGYAGNDGIDVKAEEPIPPYNRTSLETSDAVSGLRAEVVRDAPWGHVAGGVAVERTELSKGRLTFYFEDTPISQLGAWVEHRWSLGGGRLTIKTGVRADQYRDDGVAQPIALAPRVHITELAHPRVRVRAALAQERRPIGVGSRAVLIAVRAIGYDLEQDVPRPRATHAQLAVDLEILDGLTVTPGLFAIDADDVELPQTLQQRDPNGDPIVSPFGAVARELMAEALGQELDDADAANSPFGRGRARGVDVVTRLDRGRWNGLVSYTYSRTERESSVRMDVPAWKPYILDQPHNLSAALSARVGWWRLGARVRYVSGGPMPYEGFMLPERLPDYADLSVRVERGWRRRWGEVHAFVDVQNATNRKNIEDIVSENIGPREIVGLPFLPFVGVEYRPLSH